MAIGILIINIYDLKKELKSAVTEIENLKKLVKPPPANKGFWFPDPAPAKDATTKGYVDETATDPNSAWMPGTNTPPGSGFWVTQPQQTPPPPVLPEIANLVPNTSFGTQTSPLDNQLPLRGTAK